MTAHAHRKPPSDEELLTLAQLGLPEDKAIYVALRQMRKNSPRLTQEQIDRISDEVAAKILHELHPVAPDHWKPKIRQAMRDILLGVIASGVWELFVYLSTHVMHLSGAEGYEEQDKRVESAQWKLVRGMDNEDRKDLENQVIGLKKIFAQPFVVKCEDEICRTPFFKELVEEDMKRKTAVDDGAAKTAIRQQREDIAYILLRSLRNASIDNLVPLAKIQER